MKAKICYGVETESILLEASKFLLSLHGMIDSLQESSHATVLELSRTIFNSENQGESAAAVAWKIDMMRRKLVKIDEKLEDTYDILLGYNNFLEEMKKEKEEVKKDDEEHEEG
tara:strand:+ start:140 stop:478 length:339 start_codon:yes stop_codon:yes gene_type:complete